jgi:hypothetical protein
MFSYLSVLSVSIKMPNFEKFCSKNLPFKINTYVIFFSDFIDLVRQELVV